MKILIVEDELKLGESLMKGLKQEGYTVDHMTHGGLAETRILASTEPYDLLLLDVMLPGTDGLNIAKNIRQKGITTPILMLTARDTKEDIVLGLDQGADDYLVKPFAFEELLARIRALTRRPKQFTHKELTTHSLVMNSNIHKVFLRGHEIKLTRKEFTILEYFMRHAGEVVTREDILSQAWDFAFDSFSNVVDVHIKNLRKKINTSKNHELLETVRGIGYRLKA
jgi:DNA-binding response OmpR family regulator